MCWVLRNLIAMLVFLPLTLAAQVSVQVQSLEEVLVDLERRAPADVRPLNDAVLAAEVSAVVVEVFADVGQVVSAGDPLLLLDPTDYQLALEQAQAQLRSSIAQKTQADARLDRAKELVRNNYLSDDDLLARTTEVVVLEAQIQVNEVAISVARRNLERCEITAPFDGVVADRMAQVGSFVTNGSPLINFTQVDQFELDAEIPVSVADSLAEAESIVFSSRGETWPLELLRLSPVVETSRRSQRARFTFAEEAPAVGRSGEVIWLIEYGLLPASLVSRREGELGVFLHENGMAVFKPLPQAQEGRPVAVNFYAGAEIIVIGRDRLQDGDAVTVRP